MVGWKEGERRGRVKEGGRENEWWKGGRETNRVYKAEKQKVKKNRKMREIVWVREIM